MHKGFLGYTDNEIFRCSSAACHHPHRSGVSPSRMSMPQLVQQVQSTAATVWYCVNYIHLSSGANRCDPSFLHSQLLQEASHSIEKSATPAMRNAVSAVIFSTFVSGMLYLSVHLRAVPSRHIIFVVGTAVYASLANAFILRTSDSLPGDPRQPRSLSPMKNSARLLFPFTIVVSLFVPAVLLAVAPKAYPRPSQLHAVVAPHLFLMLSQIVLETIGYVLSSFYTLYVRLGVTIAFVGYRIPVILTWYHMAVAWAQSTETSQTPAFAPALVQAAAVLNLVFWSFALLCYLLLYCLPAVCRDPSASEESQKTS